MFPSRDSGHEPIVCSNPDCPQQRFPARDLLFLCPGGRYCPGLRKDRPPEHEEHYPDQFLFHASKYAYSAPCPHSPHVAFRKVCPYCWALQPVATGQSSTIAVIGSSSSGKTCFITSLIHQIERHLARRAAFQMSLEWNDQDGLEYFREHKREIFSHGRVPEPTRSKARIRSLQITVRFPISGRLRRWRRGKQGVVSMVFPDPAGELLENLNDAYFLHVLTRAEAIILMVDPFASPQYRDQWVRDEELRRRSELLIDGHDALNAFVHNMRGQIGDLRKGRVSKDLAVVVTKCDEEGVFDPDADEYDLPVQTYPYSKGIADEISERVEQHMELDLGFAHIGTLARQSFRNVAFFAASALGSPPRIVEENGEEVKRVDNAKPRRVEDPFLWILHKWGYF